MQLLAERNPRAIANTSNNMEVFLLCSENTFSVSEHPEVFIAMCGFDTNTMAPMNIVQSIKLKGKFLRAM